MITAKNWKGLDDVTLAIIQVGDDPASDVYVRNKIKTCASIGIETVVSKHDYDINFGELKKVIKDYAEDKHIDGIILQLPLPKHLQTRTQTLLDEIPWYKDVDGLSTESIGRLWTGRTCLKPATALGVWWLLSEETQLTDSRIAIVGRSPLIGKPLIKMLMDEDATIKVYHSYSDCKDVFKDNDIVISGIGNTDLVEYYDGKTLWIDCGIIRKEDGTICGDAGDLKSEYITPVPCGIGTLTTACIALNTAYAHDFQKGRWS